MIFLDANGTYPVDPGHYDAVAQRLKDMDGNPSAMHAPGRRAKVALESARASVSRLLGARPAEVIFTSGATEANNLVVQGVLAAATAAHTGVRSPHIVITAGEHASITETAALMAARGLCRLSVAPLRRSGEVDSEALEAMIEPETQLIGVMMANNESGAINDLRALLPRWRARAPGAHVHTDAVQMLGKDDLRWLAGSGIDSAAFSAHKIGAFKGIGALFLRQGRKLERVLIGGGQERGRRAGTENMPGIMSFGLRCDALTPAVIQDAATRMATTRAAFLKALAAVPGNVVHGEAPKMLPNTVNFHIDGVGGDDLLLNLDLLGMHASSGSACSSGVARPSHVLMAMGFGEWVALNSVRCSFTAESRGEDMEAVVKVIHEVVARVKGRA